MADNTPQSFEDVIARLGHFFKGLSFQQRLWLGAGVALVAGTLWVFVALLGQPKYVTLYSGLRPEDAQALGAKLAAKNIPHQISADGGSLLVPEDKLDASRLDQSVVDELAHRCGQRKCRAGGERQEEQRQCDLPAVRTHVR